MHGANITKKQLEDLGVVIINSPLLCAVEGNGTSIKANSTAPLTYWCKDIFSFIERHNEYKIYLYWNNTDDSPYHKEYYSYNGLLLSETEYNIRAILNECHTDNKQYTSSTIKQTRDKRLLLAQ